MRFVLVSASYSLKWVSRYSLSVSNEKKCRGQNRTLNYLEERTRGIIEFRNLRRVVEM